MEQISTMDKKMLDLLIRGYDRAALSFASMISQPVRINTGNITLSSDFKNISTVCKGRANSVAVQTKIIGEISGESYLIMTDSEINTICDLSRKAFGGDSNIPNDLVLNEIDNILSAAVITEISNALKVKIFGDVPHLIHLQNGAQDFEEIIRGSINEDSYLLISNTSFVFDSHQMINPCFLWLFDNKLVEMVDELAKVES